MTPYVLCRRMGKKKKSKAEERKAKLIADYQARKTAASGTPSSAPRQSAHRVLTAVAATNAATSDAAATVDPGDDRPIPIARERDAVCERYR